MCIFRNRANIMATNVTTNSNLTISGTLTVNGNAITLGNNAPTIIFGNISSGNATVQGNVTFSNVVTMNGTTNIGTGSGTTIKIGNTSAGNTTIQGTTTLSGATSFTNANIVIGNTATTPNIRIGNGRSGSTTIYGAVNIGTDGGGNVTLGNINTRTSILGDASLNGNTVVLGAAGNTNVTIGSKTGGITRVSGKTVFSFTLGTADVDFESRPRFFSGIRIYNSDTTKFYQIYMEDNGTLCIYHAGGNGMFIGYGGNGWGANSDKRIKNTITDISSGLNIINELNPVSFYFNGNDKISYGFIAQDVEKVIPELVCSGGYNETIQDYLKGIQLTDIIPFLVKSIQEQDIKITNLEKEISLLKELLVAKL